MSYWQEGEEYVLSPDEYEEADEGPGELPDEQPLSEEEEAWGRAYWRTLSEGEPEPSGAGLDPARLARIREWLEADWRRKVRRVTRRKA